MRLEQSFAVAADPDRTYAFLLDVNRVATSLLIGAVVWAYLGVLFEFLMETVAWERWEGTIEYTFMAPLSRSMHLAGMGVFSVLYGLLRAVFLFTVCVWFFDLSVPDAEFMAALVVLAIASISFLGIGIVPPYPSWGSMIADTYGKLRTPHWFLLAEPLLIVTMLLYAFAYLGDGLADALNPQTR